MAKSKRKPPRVLPKVRSSYRIEVLDMGKLQTVYSGRLTALRVCLAALLLLGVGIVIGVLIIGFTPMKRKMPGAVSSEQRNAAMRTLMRADSLEAALQVNQAFMDNLATLLDTSREPADSVAASGTPARGLSLDSLVGSSARERKFVAMMEESEKYNLKVLSPLAAEGMIWSDPVPEGIVVETSRTLHELRYIVPMGAGVSAMADGRVIDRTVDAATRSFSITVQHTSGFVTRYSSLPVPLVNKGDRVLSGQMLAEPFAKGSRQAVIEMWRDGTPLIPAEYVGRKNASATQVQSIESPRGR